MPTPSAFLVWSFVVLPLLVAAAFIAGIRLAWLRTGAPRAAARRAAFVAADLTAAWMAATLLAARAGALRFDGRPPTMMLLLATILLLGVGLARSPVGRRLAAGVPLALLVGVQGFRLPLELAMHRAYEEGVMPVQMSYSGLNFDVVTGATAILVALLVGARRAPRWLVGAWNVLGLLLLANVLVVALLAAPTPFRRLTTDPPNVWVTQPPFVWLPAVLVLAALLGHLVIWRRLRHAPPAAG